MSRLPPDHEVIAVLREIPRHRRVLRTRVRGVECVTRVLLSERVHPNQGDLIRRIVLSGRGSLTGVPEAVALTLEGYRVAARCFPAHPPDEAPRWPQAVAAGLTEDHLAFVSTTWMRGTPLHEVGPERLRGSRERVALDVLGILGRLHAEHVAYGDLKPENVVVDDDAHAALIDLDTLREVPDFGTAAVTRDLSRHWAAPEQERDRQTYLASDLWAWAQLVRRLYPEGAPDAWAAAVAACHHPDPMRRPHTVSLLGALVGGGSSPLLDWHDRPVEPVPERGPEPSAAPVEGTERVEDARAPVESTERVPELGGSPPRPPSPPSGPTVVPGAPPAPSPPPPAHPATTSSNRGCMHLVASFGVAAALLCTGALGWGGYEYLTADAERVRALEHALEAYKTDPALNNNTQRAALDELGAGPAFAYHSPRWKSLAALARAWAAGWQDSSREWETGADGARADGILDEVAGIDVPEARLARATTHAALCRVRPADLSTSEHCAEALEELDGFFAAVDPGPDTHWMKVEAAWTEVLVRSEAALTAAEQRLPAEAVVEEAARGLTRCEESQPWLAYAPVNGRELVQDCLVLAGIVPDLPRYRAHAEWLLAADPPPLDRSTLRHLYTAAGPGCVSTSVDKRRGEWVVKGDPWCVAVGHFARGCTEASATVIARDAGADATRPWATLVTALADVPQPSVCAK